MHKRFRNPRRGYARAHVKAEAAQAVDEALHSGEVQLPDSTGLSRLMSAPADSPVTAATEPTTPRQAVAEAATAPERMLVTSVVRGAAAEPGTRELSPAQRRIDRILDMLRRSR